MGHCVHKKKITFVGEKKKVKIIPNSRPDYHIQSFHHKTLDDINSMLVHLDQRAYQVAYQEHHFEAFHQRHQLNFLQDPLISKIMWK